jgi:cyclic nucleotide gated channel
VQIIILVVLPKGLGISGANNAKNLLRAAVLVQYIPRLWRFTPLLIGQSPSGFIFETALANFFINLFTYILSGHIVGSCWYLFGLQVSVLSFISQTFSYPFEYPEAIMKSVTILDL